MSEPLSENAALRRIVKARDEIGDRRLPRAAPPDQRDHRSARHRDVEVAHDRPALAILELDVLEPDLVHDRAARRARRAGPACRASIASTSNTRSIAASDRCSSENELTMFHTGLSSRNVYHWNAMMSPIDARPRDVQIAAVPDDHDVHAAEQQAPRRPEHQLAAVREQLLAQHRVAAAHVVEQLGRLAPERAHDANARERFADAAVDLLGVLAHRAVDRPDAARERRSSSPSRPG